MLFSFVFLITFSTVSFLPSDLSFNLIFHLIPPYFLPSFMDIMLWDFKKLDVMFLKRNVEVK